MDPLKDAAEALAKEIDDLDKPTESPAPADEKSKEEEPPKEEPPKESTKTESEKTTEEPSAKKESLETEPDKDARYEALVSQINTLSQTILDLQGKAPKVEAKKEPEVKPTDPPVKDTKPAPEEDYVGNLDMDDVTSDPKVFNSVLNNFKKDLLASINVEGVIDQAVKRTLLGIPSVIQSQIRQQASVDELVRDFYDANKDLTSIKQTVGMVAQNIAAEHPDWTVKQVFDESAKKTRELLQLPVPSDVKETLTNENPALAKRSAASKRDTDLRTNLQRELDEI